MPPLKGTLTTKELLPGVHRVHRTLSDGGMAAYWYAWRGGPLILKAVAPNALALSHKITGLFPAALAAYQDLIGPKPDGVFLAGLIQKYLSSAQYARLAPRTQSDYRRALDVVRDDLGTMELRALEARKALSVLMDWRDKYKGSPKTADDRMGALSLVLEWARKRGDIPENPLREFPRLYRVNRAEMIWSDDHLDLLLSKVKTKEGRLAIRFAAYTGLRLGDLAALAKSAVKPDVIVWQTAKSGGKRTVVIPITDEIDQILGELPDRTETNTTTLLITSRGKPWTTFGLQTTLQKAKQAVAEEHFKKTGEATSPIHHLRFHDLRGTAVTRFVKAGLKPQEVALIMGWAPERVENIKNRYVTDEASAKGLRVRLTAAKREREELEQEGNEVVKRL
jgi:integrase